ncbi:MAG: hypothetical protein E7001_03720 [Coriobacteriaceae bacterium]|nr:hypothetical protein [Coriobacteriaceae bacterium]
MQIDDICPLSPRFVQKSDTSCDCRRAPHHASTKRARQQAADARADKGVTQQELAATLADLAMARDAYDRLKARPGDRADGDGGTVTTAGFETGCGSGADAASPSGIPQLGDNGATIAAAAIAAAGIADLGAGAVMSRRERDGD